MASNFDDFDKKARDLLSEDYIPFPPEKKDDAGKVILVPNEKQFFMKIKSAGPSVLGDGASVFTTTTVYDSNKNELKPKISLKLPLKYGFSFDKLEMPGQAIDFSYCPELVPGLTAKVKTSEKGGKVTTIIEAEFKKDKDLTAICNTTTDMKTVNVSVLTATPITTGFSLKYAKDEKEGDTLMTTLGAAYTLPVKASLFGKMQFEAFSQKFKDASFQALYPVNNKLSVSALVDCKSGKGDKLEYGGVVGASYNCTATTCVKGKFTYKNYILAGALKQTFPNKLSVSPAMEVALFKPTEFKWGVTASLG